MIFMIITRMKVMKRISFLFLLIISNIWYFSCNVQNIKSIEYKDVILNFKCPRHISLKKEKVMIDFIIYGFYLNEAKILNLYLGNQPSLFFNKGDNRSSKKISINGIECFLYQMQNEDTKFNKEFVLILNKSDKIYIPNNEDDITTEMVLKMIKLPKVAHFWYSSLDNKMAKIADMIVFSIEKVDK